MAENEKTETTFTTTTEPILGDGATGDPKEPGQTGASGPEVEKDGQQASPKPSPATPQQETGASGPRKREESK